MSAASRAAPSMSARSRIMSRRGSHQADDELAVGAVIVILSDKTEGQNGGAYRSPTRDDNQDDAKLISTTTTQNGQCFVAVLAPSSDAAMASLHSQPPGTYLLVKEEDAAITVYVKFRQAVRVMTLVKSKDAKKNSDTFQLAKLRKKDPEHPPVHNLRLSSEAYFLVEHCWKRFLPAVQAVVFELCCETYFDEDTKLEEWTLSMIPPSSYAVGMMPEACGFYILAVPPTDADVYYSSVIQIRQVEFDFTKFTITIADGVLKPSALLLATSFSTKRTFEPEFAFGALRDNFLTPDLVMLKETSVTMIPSQQSSLQNCIDLTSNDRELMVLTAVDAACGEIMPNEPLPESLLSVLHEMHLYFVNSAVKDGVTLSSKRALWSAPKMKLAGRIIPILLELVVASATMSVTINSTDQMDVQAVAAENKRRLILAQFSHAVRFDLLFMTARGDDSVICRLAHQLCQFLGAHIRIPADLADLIRDLVALFPVFLRLFLRVQGTVMLWRNIQQSDVDKDSVPDPQGRSFLSIRSLTSSSTIANAVQHRERRSSLFSLSRKPQAKARKSLSLSLGMSLFPTPSTSSKGFAFSHLNFISVQVYLGMNLHEGFFTCPDVWKEDPALANVLFCACKGQQCDEPVSVSAIAAVSTRPVSMCARTRVRSRPKMATYEFLLQLSLRFLYKRNSFENWDRDVALLLRLEDVHRHIFNEIICIVRRRTEAQDDRNRAALSCELRVVIACVSTLFRLERKRRQEMGAAIGDKKYLAFIQLFRSKIRELNEKLHMDSSCDDQVEAEEDNQHEKTDDYFLGALAAVFKWIPRALLDEWVVLSLKELLQTLNELSNGIKQATMSSLKQPQYIRHIYEIFSVFSMILKRTSDPDIQSVLVRVLGMDCPAIISLIRFVLSPNSLGLNGGRDAISIQTCVLHLLRSFLNLDVALPIQHEWEAKNSNPSEEGSMNEDAAAIEQLKGELIIRLLGPQMTIEDGEQTDQSLWDLMLELMFPDSGNDTVASFHSASCILNVASTFRSESVPPILLTNISRSHFQLEEAFLLLQQALYTTQDASSPIDYDHCVASHLRRIDQYSCRIIENEGQEDPGMVYRMMELNLRCLIVLASRRAQFPAIQEAFCQNRVLLSILQRIQPPPRVHHDIVCTLSHRRVSFSDEVGAASHSLPPLKLPRQLSSGPSEISGIQANIAQLSLPIPPKTMPSYDEINISQNFILAEPGLHTLAIVLMATYVIVDPNLELDETVCLRISVPGEAATEPSELLWKLQQHLSSVDLDQRYFEALMLEMETLQACVSNARVSAIRSLLRLLCPNRFDCNLYTTTQGVSRQKREYIAKGAFSTVYRQHPSLPRPESVAIKVVEHQRRAGELCAVNGLFNEVSILSKLRGEKAATQLVDFGNNYAEQSFEIVMEYCTSSLTEWRETIKRTESEVPFRSCLVMILRAFEEACQCLTRIHQAGVCHFDIKSDNILVRSSARELSRKLLENDEEGESTDAFKGWICFADFGESKLVDTDQLPMRTFTFSSFSTGNASPVAVRKRTEKFMSLTRTRGTEAIKSPEVLKVKGSEVAEVKVTLASDIWSLGCLLYELVTQELPFQNDDWAGLYAHLVVTQDQSVLRSDHQEKISTVLHPSSSDEEAVVTSLLALCSNILVREPTRRPKLETILTELRKLISDVSNLPVTANDDSFVRSLRGQTSPPEAERPASAPRSFAHVGSCRQHASSHGVIVPVRLFWNFFVAAAVTRTPDTQKMSGCLGNGSDPAGKDVLVMDAFESRYESDFVHFVYVSWHESCSTLDEANSQENAQEFIVELHEEEHRTCFLLNSKFKPNIETSLFQQLVQHAPQYFPVLQRRLRDNAGCVVFVSLGEDINDLQEVVTGMLMFFLRSALAMFPFDLFSSFARDCGQFFDYPRPEFIQQLMSYSTSYVQDTATSRVVQCYCGASIFTVDSIAMAEARATQLCTCSASTTCVCFHPFPATDGSYDDEFYPVDSMFVHDGAEEQLVHPFETRAMRGEGVRWVSVDSVSVGRMDCKAFRWSPLSLGATDNTSRTISFSTGTGSEAAAVADRRVSRFGLLKRQTSKVASEQVVAAVVEPQERQEMLLRGLQRRGKPSDSSSSDAWELYECELCRLPICAVAEVKDKVAVPLLLHPRSNS